MLSPPEGSGRCPTLLTGVQPSDLKNIETFGWKDKLETADLEKHSAYLQDRHFMRRTGGFPDPRVEWSRGIMIGST